MSLHPDGLEWVAPSSDQRAGRSLTGEMAGFPEMPEGPVTIMFTDVEGSTALRTTVGDARSRRAPAPPRRPHPGRDRGAQGPRPGSGAGRRVPRGLRVAPPGGGVRHRDPEGARHLQPLPRRRLAEGAHRAQHRRGRLAGRSTVGRSRARRRPGLRRRRRRPDPRLRRHPSARRDDPRRDLPRRGRVRAQGLPAAVAALGRHLGPRDEQRSPSRSSSVASPSWRNSAGSCSRRSTGAAASCSSAASRAWGRPRS